MRTFCGFTIKLAMARVRLTAVNAIASIRRAGFARRFAPLISPNPVMSAVTAATEVKSCFALSWIRCSDLSGVSAGAAAIHICSTGLGAFPWAPAGGRMSRPGIPSS